MFKRVLSLIKKEFIMLFKDPKSRTLIFAPPLIQLIVFANAITMEVKNIDVVLWDKSKTVISRDFLADFENSPRFRHAYYVDNNEKLHYLIDTQKAQAAIIVGEDFERNFKNKVPQSVALMVDGRNTNSAAIIQSYVMAITNNFNERYFPYNSSKIVVRNRFNPNLEYQYYLLVSLVTLLSLIVTLLLTSLSVAREKEAGTFERLLISPLSPFEILLGKTIPPLCVATGLTCFMMAVSIFVFHVPFRGSLPLFLLTVFCALLSITGVGLFVSSVSKTQQQAILGAFTFQIPAVLLSGFVSPVSSMPVFLQYLTLLNPIRFFMAASKAIFLKDLPFLDLIPFLIPLIVIAILTLSLASYTFRSKLE